MQGFVVAFLNFVRPLLLKKEHPNDKRVKSPKYLWINTLGSAMEHNTFTREIRSITQQFNRYLRVTPIDWRRMTITDLFKRRHENFF
jgi:hypothetical protein